MEHVPLRKYGDFPEGNFGSLSSGSDFRALRWALHPESEGPERLGAGDGRGLWMRASHGTFNLQIQRKNSFLWPGFGRILSDLASFRKKHGLSIPTKASLFLACFLVCSLLVLFIFTGGLQKTKFFCYHTKSRDERLLSRGKQIKGSISIPDPINDHCFVTRPPSRAPLSRFFAGRVPLLK